MKKALITKIQNIIGKPGSDEREIVSLLKKVIAETELQGQRARKSEGIGDLVAENLTQLKEGAPHGYIIKTGFAEFDKLFGGFGRGEFIVIGGRPSMGKTQLVVNLARNISLDSPILYFTYDLSKDLLATRFISSFTGIAVNKLLQNELTAKEKALLASIGGKFSNYQILMNDSCNSSITAFKALCQKHIEDDGVEVIIVDYLQMMSSNDFRNNRELQINYISRELKNIAKDYNVCVIASSQLSRSVESRGGEKRPQLSDLRESGAIEQDADKVIFLYRPDYYGIMWDESGDSIEGLTEIILAKNRNGSVGSVYLMRDANFTSYRDYGDTVNLD